MVLVGLCDLLGILFDLALAMDQHLVVLRV
jgi:hypothetical protein